MITERMPSSTATSLSLPERLLSFEGYWDEDEATARQLAAIGHVYDRPPLAALDEGTYCISCGAFVRREDSITSLQESIFKAPTRRENVTKTFAFHKSNCIRLQLRIPLELQTAPGRLHSLVHSSHGPYPGSQVTKLDNLSCGVREARSHPLLALPTEIKMQIYSMIMPAMDRFTTIIATDREGTCLSTLSSFEERRLHILRRLHLLRTCSSIYDDARDIFFHATTYKFESSRVMYLFLRHIGSHGRQLLRSVDVVCGSREDAIAFALLAACPRLRSLAIRLPRPKLLPGNRASLWILDGLACLLELSGLEEVTFGECDVLPYLSDNTHDAEVLRRELTRPRGARSGIRWVDGFPDI
jgi:hypothetical protein